ncbi:MAG: hypothetical protein M1334_03655 [Patescibacteria group bacterium]|nr:hypothetical protein [Patescibacteria group bacterium]
MKPIRPVFPIGIEKETKEGEGRVILIPDHVEALVNDFSKIEKKDVVCLVETGAGVKSGSRPSSSQKRSIA